MRTLATSTAALLALGLMLLAPGAAHAYRLPPEKMLQYWASRVGRYGNFEVRVRHTLYPGGGGFVSPDVTKARILYTQDGHFRLDRQGEGRYVVLGDEQEILAVRNGVALGAETSERYAFAHLFALGRSLAPEPLEALRARGVLIKSPPVLWLLGWLGRVGVAWAKTRLAPLPAGTIAYVLGTENRDALAAGDLAAAPVPQLWLDNREFEPLELRRWIHRGRGEPLSYRTVMGEYGNEILKHYPRRIAVYVGGTLAEEFELLSVRLRPKVDAAELDLERQRPLLLQVDSGSAPSPHSPPQEEP